jgi:hypothetical protein
MPGKTKSDPKKFYRWGYFSPSCEETDRGVSVGRDDTLFCGFSDFSSAK